MNRISNVRTVSDIALAMAMRSAGFGTHNHKLKIDTAKWVVGQAEEMANPWSLILTYRHAIAGGAPTAKELASMERRLRKHFSHLVHALSKKAYGNAYRRNNKLLKFVAVFERGDNDRFHIHAIVDVPTHPDPARSYDAKFKAEVEVQWRKHGKVVEVKPVTTDKARNRTKGQALIALCLYMVKLKSKYTASCNYTDALLLVE